MKRHQNKQQSSNSISLNIPTSLGEIINVKCHADIVKSRFQQIRLNANTSLWNAALHTEAADWQTKQILWIQYLQDIGRLFFNQPPYIFSVGSQRHDFQTIYSIEKVFGVSPQKPSLGHLLCKGASLNLGEEYIVITTKIREINKHTFYPLSIKLWNTLRKLSNKYKIVILGEQIVEMRKEYNGMQNKIFSIYEQIITNISKDRILDLTVPALGETVSSLAQIQQDCLIMKEAKFVITLGIGGNFNLALASADMVIGYRTDNEPFDDARFRRPPPSAMVTKDWNQFIQALERYLR